MCVYVHLNIHRLIYMYTPVATVCGPDSFTFTQTHMSLTYTSFKKTRPLHTSTYTHVTFTCDPLTRDT